MSTKVKMPRGWHRKGKGRDSVLFSERPAKVAAARAKYLEELEHRQNASEATFLDQMEGRREMFDSSTKGAVRSILDISNRYGE